MLKTMPFTALIDYFNAYRPLSLQEKDALLNRVKEQTFKRKQFLLRENEMCTHLTFVVKGCFKMYGVDAKGKKHNLQFAAENDWIVDFASLYKQKPSQLYIEALEPSTVFQIYREDLYYLYDHQPIFNWRLRIIVENKYIELQNRVLQNISSTGYERYETFLEQYPQLSQRLSNAQIAAYLGITPEFLSKIRAERKKK
jgi:CRP/FNR family transcriptional regulator, anaerobic regulatory protein